MFWIWKYPAGSSLARDAEMCSYLERDFTLERIKGGTNWWLKSVKAQLF
jgi:hypothetical protein